MQRLPGVLVDFGFQRRLQRPVWIVGTEEVGVADEEALLVVVGVDEPAGNIVGRVRADDAGRVVQPDAFSGLQRGAVSHAARTVPS